MPTKPIRLLIINSHPIQYFAPLYRQLAASEQFDLDVLYCSRHGLAGETDRQFGQPVQWDIPLLEGYRHRFLSNQSPNPSIYSFWGLLNLSVVKALWQSPRGVVMVYGWAYAVCWLTILSAKLMGHQVCMRAESPLRLETSKSLFRQQIRRWVLGKGLLRLVDYALYIGEQNRAFYRHMGVAEQKLIFCPYAVDNARFQQAAAEQVSCRAELRRRLSISPTQKVLLYCGKYIPKKRPVDLLKAVAVLRRADVAVVLVGDGPLRPALEAFCREQQLANVHLTGFVNQSEIVRYYALADVFVLCSDEAETWGLVTNEAMNAGLPVVLSQAVGCADDLVQSGQNGYSYPCGNVPALAAALNQLLDMPAVDWLRFRACSRAIVDRYSYGQTVRNLQDALSRPSAP
ncbi:glycosyltransferase [Fibrella sp. WM1]|uniref:glycosyltransferase n=1 Tax=Fibrella musci TaxID=3242485 RepID=UPI0035210FC3